MPWIVSGRTVGAQYRRFPRLCVHRDTNTGKETEKISLNWDTLEMTTLNSIHMRITHLSRSSDCILSERMVV